MKLTTIICIAAMTACTSHGVTRGDKPTGDTTPSATPDTTLVNPVITATDTLTALRFERHSADGDTDTEVLSLSTHDTGHFLYFRKTGDYQGWHYADINARAALDSLARVVANYNLAHLPFTAFDREDTSRSRWMLRAVYASGATLSVVCYPDDADSQADTLQADVDEIFYRLIDHVVTTGEHGEFSVYTYNRGKLSQRIDYLPDGTVRGGYDADNPEATF